MDRMALMRAFRQVEADFNSGNGLDVDGTRVGVSPGAMDILSIVLAFVCSQPQPIRWGDPNLQKKMAVWLQGGVEQDDFSTDFTRRRPRSPNSQHPSSSTSSSSARSQAMAGGKRPASDPGLRHGSAAPPKRTRRGSEPSGSAAPSVAAPQAVPPQPAWDSDSGDSDVEPSSPQPGPSGWRPQPAAQPSSSPSSSSSSSTQPPAPVPPRPRPVPPRPAQPGRACKRRLPDLYQVPVHPTWGPNGTETKALRARLLAARRAPQPSQHGHCQNCHCALSSAPGPSHLCKLCGGYQHSRHGAVRPRATWEKYQRQQMVEYGRILPQPGHRG